MSPVDHTHCSGQKRIHVSRHQRVGELRGSFVASPGPTPANDLLGCVPAGRPWTLRRTAQYVGRCLLVLLVVVAVGCSTGYETAKKKPSKEPAKTAEKKPEPPPPPPKPKPVVLADLKPVALDPGSKTSIDFQVERNDNKGPIQVQVTGAPNGLEVKAADIPADQSTGKIELAASEKLGDEQLKATLQVTVKLGGQTATKPLPVTIHKVKLPSLAATGTVVLKPGSGRTVQVKIQRNGFQGPLPLKVESLPAKVTANVKPVAAGDEVAEVTLSAAPDAAEGEYEVRLQGTILGRTVGVPMKVKVERFPFRVRCFMAVTLAPGETKTVSVPIERRSYAGPIHIEVTGLPAGVTAPPVDVPAGKTSTQITLAAAPNAKELVRSAVVVTTGGSIRQNEAMVVRVSTAGHGFLPPEIAWDPNKAVLLRRGSYGGRLEAKSKAALVRSYGGTKESEEAVLRGLRWLAAHQQPDGRWSLKHYSEGIEGCDCQSDFEKEVDDNDTAGTAFGLLPMLGAGITHNGAPEEPAELSEYRKVVERGLTYLIQHQVRKRGDKNLGHLGGNMYSHAMATLALCEAYGLSQDDRLKIPAQLAIKYLMDAQHKDGGWRYNKGQAGDLSVTSWVFFAIRSAQLAGLPINRDVLVRAERFVNSCAVPTDKTRFARYAYMPGQDAKLSVTAAGLLTRQFIGWPKDNPDLLAGCKYLTQNLPPESGSSLGSIYYYHYATQVLHNMEGSEFDLWNHRMREHLIRTQQKQGHRAGSWNPEGTDWGKRGGRLYATGLALITLEVYYRHLPMYRPVARTAVTSSR